MNQNDPLQPQILDTVPPQPCPITEHGIVRAWHNQQRAWMQNGDGSFKTLGLDMSHGNLAEALLKQYEEACEHVKQPDLDGEAVSLGSSDPEPELPPFSDTSGLGHYTEPVTPTPEDEPPSPAAEAASQPPSDVQEKKPKTKRAKSQSPDGKPDDNQGK